MLALYTSVVREHRKHERVRRDAVRLVARHRAMLESHRDRIRALPERATWIGFSPSHVARGSAEEDPNRSRYNEVMGLLRLLQNRAEREENFRVRGVALTGSCAEVCVAVLRALAGRIETLCLEDCPFDPDLFFELAQFFQTAGELHEVTLNFVMPPKRSMSESWLGLWRDAWAVGLRHNRSLRALRLRTRHFASQDVETLSQALSCIPTLQLIELKQEYADDVLSAEWRALLRGLARSSSLRALHVTTMFPTDCLVALIDLPHVTDFQLTWASFEGNPLDNLATPALQGEVLSRLARIRRLGLHPMSSSSHAFLTSVMAHLLKKGSPTRLLSLDLTLRHVWSGERVLNELIRRCTRLQRLTVMQTPESRAVCDLSFGLSGSRSLRKVTHIIESSERDGGVEKPFAGVGAAFRANRATIRWADCELRQLETSNLGLLRGLSLRENTRLRRLDLSSVSTLASAKCQEKLMAVLSSLSKRSRGSLRSLRLGELTQPELKVLTKSLRGNRGLEELSFQFGRDANLAEFLKVVVRRHRTHLKRLSLRGENDNAWRSISECFQRSRWPVGVVADADLLSFRRSLDAENPLQRVRSEGVVPKELPGELVRRAKLSLFGLLVGCVTRAHGFRALCDGMGLDGGDDIKRTVMSFLYELEATRTSSEWMLML